MAVWYWKTKCLSVLSTGGEADLGRAPEIYLSIFGLQIQNTPPHRQGLQSALWKNKEEETLAYPIF